MRSSAVHCGCVSGASSNDFRSLTSSETPMLYRSLRSIALLVLVISACQDPVTPTPIAAVLPQTTAALAASDSDSYIVLLSPSVQNVDDRADEIARAHGGRLSRRYYTAVKGFAGH